MSKISTSKVLKLSVHKKKPNKTVLITGGAGFLGSQLCDRKLKKGYNVICLDSLLSGRLSNIAEFLGNKSFKFVKHDVIEPYSFDGPIDEIYNMACAASPPKYQKHPIHTLKTNIMGAMNALDLARKKGARIFQASTSEIYGDPLISPQPECYNGNVNMHGPRSCYDEGKRAAETLFHDYHNAYGVDIRIARIFNTYGPNMDPEDGRVVSNFIVQALQNNDITIYGRGNQTRSFCYVDDLLNGIEALMASSETYSSPVNIGNPVEFTMLELAQMVLLETDSRSKIIHMDLPVDDPKQRKPDITLAKSMLGWAPEVSLQQGLKKTIPYFASEISNQLQNDVLTLP
ncbi:MAG: UDP-glucuronic acid decarboxylase family protein [Amylibacter sp.]